MKKNIKKRIIIIGDEDTGKTTAIKTFIDQIKSKSSENNNLDVQTLENNATTNNNANVNDNQSKKDDKSKKKKDETDSSDSSYSTDEGNEKVKAEINAKLVYATLTIDNLNVKLHNLDFF